MGVLKRTARRWLPDAWTQGLRKVIRGLRHGHRLRKAMEYDRSVFVRGSGLFRPRVPEVLQTHILKSYHRIEKGLALAAPRPGFGIEAVQTLLDDLDAYLQQGRHDWVSVAAMQTLQAWLDFNLAAGLPQTASARRLADLRARVSAPSSGATGGTRLVQRVDIEQSAGIDFGRFARSRHSVRHFNPAPVDIAVLRDAVSQARYAPSVCNRSAGRAYLCTDRTRMQRLLSYQNGNRGFGDTAAALFVITARMAAFHTVGERNQAWIDGGLFGMTLIYALHSHGLGTCCLNWSVEPETDRAFKAEAGLPATDAVIMLLAVGHMPDNFEVAYSERRPLSDVMIEI